jgi:hypothetical protein
LQHDLPRWRNKKVEDHTNYNPHEPIDTNRQQQLSVDKNEDEINNFSKSTKKESFTLTKSILLMLTVIVFILFLNWLRKTKGLTIKRRFNYIFSRIGGSIS